MLKMTEIWCFWCRTKAEKHNFRQLKCAMKYTIGKTTLLKIHLVHKRLPLPPLASSHTPSSSFSAPLISLSGKLWRSWSIWTFSCLHPPPLLANPLKSKHEKEISFSMFWTIAESFPSVTVLGSLVSLPSLSFFIIGTPSLSVMVVCSSSVRPIADIRWWGS